jgi:hypothetical protein
LNVLVSFSRTFFISQYHFHLGFWVDWGPDGRDSTALKVVTETLQRISEDVHREKLALLWTCLLEEINRELDEVSGSSSQLLHDSSAEDFSQKTETVPGVDKSSQDGADEAAPQLGSAPFQVEWQLHLSLLNLVLEHRKGSRVSGKFCLMGSVLGLVRSLLLRLIFNVCWSTKINSNGVISKTYVLVESVAPLLLI